MTTGSPAGEPPSRGKRADAQRNRQTVLDAAAEAFVTSGVDAPIRQIAARAGVGMGTIYRHFPTRADLVTAVYRHQIEARAEAGPNLLASTDSPARGTAPVDRSLRRLPRHQTRTCRRPAVRQRPLRRAAHLFPRPPAAHLRPPARRRGRGRLSAYDLSSPAAYG